jgi:hypothetical protein
MRPLGVADGGLSYPRGATLLEVPDGGQREATLNWQKPKGFDLFGALA